MNDLTLIYYTASKIHDIPANRVRKNLLDVTENKYPIISVSQKPIEFGKNICVGDIGYNHYNIYVQILAGLKETKTSFVACCEDDTLYNLEHFEHRSNIISYNSNVWLANRERFWIKDSGPMTGACVAPTQVLMDVLENRFRMYPNGEDGEAKIRHKKTKFVEPGHPYEDLFFNNPVEIEYFKTGIPLITFERMHTLGGLRTHHGDNYDGYIAITYLEPFGNIKKLRRRYWDKM